MADDDELLAFRDREESSDEDASGGALRDLLIFDFGAVAFAVSASAVDSVIAFRPPAPVPESSPGLRGVVQDAGRIIAVLDHPTAQPRSGDERPARLVVCTTRRGLVGLPATATRGVERLPVPDGIGVGEVFQTKVGALTLLDPEQSVGVLLT